MAEIINKQCPCCGEYIPVNSTECEYCGEKFAQTETEDGNKQQLDDSLINNANDTEQMQASTFDLTKKTNIKSFILVLVSLLFLLAISIVVVKFNEINSSITSTFDKDTMQNETTDIVDTQEKASEKDIAKAKRLLSAQNYDEAAEIFQNIIDKNPQNAVAHYYMGEIYNEQGYTDLAITSYKKANENKLNFFEPLKRLAEIYTQKMDYDTALQYAEQAYTISPKNLEILNVLQTLYSYFGDTDKEIEICKKILTVDSSNYNANEILGNYYYGNENYKEAIPYFKKIITTSYNTNIAYKLVNTYKKVEYYTAALDLLDKIIENDSSEYYTVNYLKREIIELRDLYNYQKNPENNWNYKYNENDEY